MIRFGPNFEGHSHVTGDDIYQAVERRIHDSDSMQNVKLIWHFSWKLPAIVTDGRQLHEDKCYPTICSKSLHVVRKKINRVSCITSRGHWTVWPTVA